MTALTALERYGRAADGFAAALRGVPAPGWAAASPCEGWTARDVAAHVIETHRQILTRLHGGDPTPPDSTQDLLAAWEVESDAVRAALADPARAATPVQGMGGQQPFSELVGTLLTADTLLHTWDLARASGQDARLDAEVVRDVHAFLAPMDAMLRTPGGFGPAVEVAPDTDPQGQLLAFTGRRP